MKLKVVKKIMLCTVRTGDDEKLEVVPLELVRMVDNWEEKIEGAGIHTSKIQEINRDNQKVMKIHLAGKPKVGATFNLTLKYLVQDKDPE